MTVGLYPVDFSRTASHETIFSSRWIAGTVIFVINSVKSLILHMANENRQKGSAITELCTRCNSNTDDDTGKWIRRTLCIIWLHLTCSNYTSDQFGAPASSPILPYACDNCLSSKKLTLMTGEVQCPEKVIINFCELQVSRGVVDYFGSKLY